MLQSQSRILQEELYWQSIWQGRWASWTSPFTRLPTDSWQNVSSVTAVCISCQYFSDHKVKNQSHSTNRTHQQLRRRNLLISDNKSQYGHHRHINSWLGTRSINSQPTYSCRQRMPQYPQHVGCQTHPQHRQTHRKHRYCLHSVLWLCWMGEGQVYGHLVPSQCLSISRVSSVKIHPTCSDWLSCGGFTSHSTQNTSFRIHSSQPIS